MRENKNYIITNPVEEDIPGMADCLAKAFCSGDPPTLALGIDVVKNRHYFLGLLNSDALDLNLSYIAKSNDTQKVIGCLTACVMKNSLYPLKGNIDDPINVLNSLLNNLLKPCLAMSENQRIFHIQHVGILPEFMHRGIMTRLVYQAYINQIKSAHFQGAIVECTSPITHQFFLKMNMQQLNSIEYKQYHYQEKYPMQLEGGVYLLHADSENLVWPYKT